MPAIKPPFPIATGQVDQGNWRLAGCGLVAFWPFNIDHTDPTGSRNFTLEAITGQFGVAGTLASTIANDAAQRNGRRVFLASGVRGTFLSASFQRALPIAIIARAKFNSAAANNGIYSNSGTFGTFWAGAFLYQSSAGKLVCGYGDNTGTTSSSFRIKTGATTLTAGSYTDLACVIRGATDMTLYVNGVDDGGSYSGSGGSMVNTSTGTLGGVQVATLTGGLDYVMQLAPPSGEADIDATIIQNIQADPWAIVAGSNAYPWLSKRRIPRFSAIAASGVNVNLSGVAATGAVRSLTPTIGVALAGVAGAGAVGTLSVTGTATVALSGVAGTGAVGALTPSGALTLSGVAASGAVGSFSITGDATITLTGVAGEGAVGTLSPSGAATIALSGVAASGVVGSFSPALSIALAGVVGTGAVNALDAATVISLAGVTATSAVGSFGHAISVDLHGVAGTGAVHAFVPFIIPPAFDQFSLMRDSDVDCSAAMSDQGVAALGPITLEDDFTLMRSLPVASRGAMRDAGEAALGAMADDLDLFALMRSTPVAAFGLMRGTPVAARGAMP